MTYEAAPSTRLLATHCAICNRPLRDAESVERGIGPDCAERYGHGDASGPMNVDAVVAAAENAGEIALTIVREHTDAHTVANRAVHYVAVLAHDDHEANADCIAALCDMIAACGYDRLAARLRERVAAVFEARAQAAAEEARRAPTLVIAEANGALSVGFRNLSSAQFHAMLATLRGIPSRRYNAANKSNTIAAEHRGLLWNAIRTSEVLRGAWIESAKGRAQITA